MKISSWNCTCNKQKSTSSSGPVKVILERLNNFEEFIAVQPRTLVSEAIGLFSSINSELRISEETATRTVPITITIIKTMSLIQPKKPIKSKKFPHWEHAFVVFALRPCKLKCIILQTCDHKYVAWDKFVYTSVLSPKSGYFWCSQRTLGCL